MTLYFNGDILTMDGAEPEAVFVKDGRIAGTGSLQELRERCKGQAREFDLRGRTLMPSFIDTHSHITMAAQVSAYADLGECCSFQDIQDVLCRYKEEHAQSCQRLIVGFGYDHNVLEEQRHPDKYILDLVSEEIPVFIIHASAHMGVCNSKALEAAGITDGFPDPEGGRFGRVSGTAEPNGYAEEAAMMQMQFSFGELLQADSAAAMEQTQQMYLRYGVTTVQDGASSAQTIAGLRALASAGGLKLDVVAYPVMAPGEMAEGMPNTAEDVGYDNHFRIGGYKLILDGSPQGKSAWLSAPYEGEESYCGYPWMEDEAVFSCCMRAVREGQQLLAHCNGDAASEQYLNCYERALQECSGQEALQEEKLRPVMIHCQTVREDQLERMAQLSMIASFFVGHVYYWGDVHLKNLGGRRGNKISPAATAKELGICFTFHQDTPVTKPDMLHSVWCAVNRRTRKGIKIGEEEGISVYDALRAVTIDAAYQYHEENNKGTLTPGKLADMIVLNHNPLKVPPDELREIQVDMTIKEGEVVYQRQQP